MPTHAADEPLTLSLPDARRMWYARQGLAEPRSRSVAETVAATGWLRTFGGNAYVGGRARIAGFRREDLDEAVFASESLLNVPSVHSCVMLVPAPEARYSLSAAVGKIERETARTAERCGVESAEIDALGEAILAELAGGGLTADELRRRLPAGSIRDLGEQGKKLGDTSTLTVALRRLGARGLIQRLPVGDRLDNGRLRYRRFGASPWAEAGPVAEELLDCVLVARFLAWAAPASLDEIQTWTDIGKRRTVAALATLGATPVHLEQPDGGTAEAWLGPDDPYLTAAPPPARQRLVFLPVDDNLMGLRAGVRQLLEDADRHVTVDGKPVVSFRWWDYHVVVDEGRVIGLWEWHPRDERVVWRTFRPLPAADHAILAHEATDLGGFIAGLGSLRQSSLDSEAAQLKRVAAIEALGTAQGF
jgi:hypothetical protein